MAQTNGGESLDQSCHQAEYQTIKTKEDPVLLNALSVKVIIESDETDQQQEDDQQDASTASESDPAASS